MQALDEPGFGCSKANGEELCSHEKTGLSKSALVKQALSRLSTHHEATSNGGLFALGAARFGRHGDVTRQSKEIKRVVRERLNAKHSGR